MASVRSEAGRRQHPLNPSIHQFDGAVERFPFPVIAHDVQVSRSHSPFEIEAVVTIGVGDRIKFELGIADVTTHGAVASGIHHQAADRAIGADPQIHAAVLHLHRAGKHQPSAHGAAQQHAGQVGQPMATFRLPECVRRGDRHQADATACCRCSDQPIDQIICSAQGNVDIGTSSPFCNWCR